MPDEWTDVQERARKLILDGESNQKVGDACGVHKTTVTRWKQKFGWRCTTPEAEERRRHLEPAAAAADAAWLRRRVAQADRWGVLSTAAMERVLQALVARDATGELILSPGDVAKHVPTLRSLTVVAAIAADKAELLADMGVPSVDSSSVESMSDDELAAAVKDELAERRNKAG